MKTLQTTPNQPKVCLGLFPNFIPNFENKKNRLDRTLDLVYSNLSTCCSLHTSSEHIQPHIRAQYDCLVRKIVIEVIL